MIVAAALAAGLFVAADAETTLAPYGWSARPILVFAAAGDPRFARQRALFEAHAADLAERDNLVILDTTESSALRRRYRPGDFAVILIGKDGGEKFRSAEVVDPRVLDALIDTMPMRRNEMGADR